jgi:hypothetical protein
MSVTHRVETVGPKKAAKYLTKNPKNRKISPVVWKRYAKAMVEGNWALTGEPLIFDDDGNLLDGQHRLTACVESGVSFTTLVIRGIDKDTWAKMNIGRSRTLANVLQAENIPYANRIASAANMAMAIEDAEEAADSSPIGTREKVDPDELLAYVKQNLELLHEAVLAVSKDQGPSILRPPSVFIALYLLLAKKNRTRTREFFEALTSGEVLTKEDPAWRLRATLISKLSQKNVRTKKLWLIGVTIKAWNAHLQGKKIKQLKFGLSESFPKIRARR